MYICIHKHTQLFILGVLSLLSSKSLTKALNATTYNGELHFFLSYNAALIILPQLVIFVVYICLEGDRDNSFRYMHIASKYPVIP
mmetsp:Transcript_20546/g.20823  ORF Transcript_20546/g.20823 Transcript_20546/m.20823 type:complete len:85 (-) Transcript_20546:380-634(-)